MILGNVSFDRYLVIGQSLAMGKKTGMSGLFHACK